MKTHVFTIGAVLLTFVLLSAPSPAQAAPVPLGEAFSMYFHGETCDTCWPPQPLPDVTIDGFLTVVPVTGASFWDPMYGAGAWSGGLMVTGITGNMSLDCGGIAGCSSGSSYALSYLQAPLGDGSYLLGGLPRYLVFSAVGSSLNTRIINDNANNLIQWNSPPAGFGSQAPITWSAVRVPEPSTLSLMAAGLAGIAALASRRRKRSSGVS